MNFSGEFHNTIDAKGRVSIPVEFREALLAAGEAEVLVVTKNRENGLTAFPLSEWRDFAASIENQSNRQVRTAMNRLYLAPKSEVGFDRQGRISLGKALRLWAGIDADRREVVEVGNFRRIDIFSQARYDEVVGSSVDILNDDALGSELDLP